jgi:hypothetical protein
MEGRREGKREERMEGRKGGNGWRSCAPKDGQSRLESALEIGLSGSESRLILQSSGQKTTTHSATPTWSGSGSLLQGYCTTPQYVILDGLTVYWAPIVVCADCKSDCCPYFVASTSSPTVVISVSIVTVILGYLEHLSYTSLTSKATQLL